MSVTAIPIQAIRLDQIAARETGSSKIFRRMVSFSQTDAELQTVRRFAIRLVSAIAPHSANVFSSAAFVCGKSLIADCNPSANL